jgi:hypothetical protein
MTERNPTTELLEALQRWYRAHHHGTSEDVALQSDLLAQAYADFTDGADGELSPQIGDSDVKER